MLKRFVRAKVRKQLNPFALDTSNAAIYIGCSEAMLRKMRADGTGPCYCKIKSKIVYAITDLKSFLKERRSKKL